MLCSELIMGLIKYDECSLLNRHHLLIKVIAERNRSHKKDPMHSVLGFSPLSICITGALHNVILIDLR